MAGSAVARWSPPKLQAAPSRRGSSEQRGEGSDTALERKRGNLLSPAAKVNDGVLSLVSEAVMVVTAAEMVYVKLSTSTLPVYVTAGVSVRAGNKRRRRAARRCRRLRCKTEDEADAASRVCDDSLALALCVPNVPAPFYPYGSRRRAHA